MNKKGLPVINWQGGVALVNRSRAIIIGWNVLPQFCHKYVGSLACTAAMIAMCMRGWNYIAALLRSRTLSLRDKVMC